ncbi:SKP1/BTB/POZ domain-containing protein [Orpheovirus IHUMI-LCC2]|uniref:SKP1/BTB/POZ domain-containing protein n=1 Tax=Orpheovirus IHUMI-LCC2 TaxID=2023057 RepID=A0A2I2L3S9_9VIRU|nr:SKP1/BTB/POZ domain-containing protein [Orpheovirus IHUMI-LCC2]SNW62202.1 SKP1/BTB/POZ domain-containing protein [Orpheovirus IHUMI-LCC2]
MFASYLNNKEFSDIIIYTKDGEIIHSHKIVLSLSPFFKTMFNNNMIESIECKIKLDIDKDLCLFLLEYLYNNMKLNVENYKLFIYDRLEDIMYWMNFLQIEELRSIIYNYIVNNKDNLEYNYNIYYLLHYYDMTPYLEKHPLELYTTLTYDADKLNDTAYNLNDTTTLNYIIKYCHFYTLEKILLFLHNNHYRLDIKGLNIEKISTEHIKSLVINNIYLNICIEYLNKYYHKFHDDYNAINFFKLVTGNIETSDFSNPPIYYQQFKFDSPVIFLGNSNNVWLVRNIRKLEGVDHNNLYVENIYNCARNGAYMLIVSIKYKFMFFFKVEGMSREYTNKQPACTIHTINFSEDNILWYNVSRNDITNKIDYIRKSMGNMGLKCNVKEHLMVYAIQSRYEINIE